MTLMIKQWHLLSINLGQGLIFISTFANIAFHIISPILSPHLLGLFSFNQIQHLILSSAHQMMICISKLLAQVIHPQY